MPDKMRVVQNAARSFSERELLPIAAEIDRDARFPWEVVDKMGALGYFGIQAPP
jgi:butyryl-CoA dehydrogenase